MKILQKFILPILIIIAIFLVYKFYFEKSEGLGSFSDFDPNNNAVKEIRVHLLIEKGIEQHDDEVSFFSSDKNGTEVKVYGNAQLPEGIETANIIIIKGHLTQIGFHVHEVMLD